MTEYFYKLLSIVLLVLLLIVTAVMGYEWHMAAHDRDKAEADFKAERDISRQLRSAIDEQNILISGLGKDKDKAEAKGAQARALAVANSRLLDAALDQVKDAKASTCTEAMPVVNTILKGIR